MHAIELIRQILSPIIKLAPSKIQMDTPFEKYGANSVMQMTLIRDLEKITGSLAKTLLFEYSTLEELTDYLLDHHSDALRKSMGSKTTSGQPGRPRIRVPLLLRLYGLVKISVLFGSKTQAQ